MKYGLTKNQQKYFNFISKYIQENGTPPSYREMADHFSTSKSVVSSNVNNLERRGWIKKLPAAHRSIVII